MAGTGFSYNPLVSGQRIKYWLGSLSGYYHYDTNALDAWNVSYIRNVVTSFSERIGCENFFGNQVFNVAYNHELSVEDSPVDLTNSLQNALCISSEGVPYLGEGINVRGIIMPYEAIITKNPIIGEVIDCHSKVYNGETFELLMSDYHWKYKTSQIYSQWNNYSNVVRVDLAEFNSEYDSSVKDVVYTYFFAENIGIVQLYWGEVDPISHQVTGKVVGRLLNQS